MEKKRVVITGIGVVTPIGIGVAEFWDSLASGRNGISKISRFDTSGYPVITAGEVKNFDPTEYIEPKDLRKMDRFVQYGWTATQEAVKDSGLDLEREDLERIGVIIGSGIGGAETWEGQHKRLLQFGPGRVSPFFVPMMISDMACGHISIKLGAKGTNYCTVSACASGAHGIGQGFRSIQYGDDDLVIAGGTEAPITPLALAGFSAMKALSTRNDEPERASRPFDKERDGFVMAEGAGICVLEELGHALKRGARIYAELIGYGTTGDAYHITAPAPEGEGAARAMSRCLGDAGLEPRAVDYINAHGTSTPLNDKFETQAIKAVFTDVAYEIPVSSTKSMLGHLLGAAGAVEFIATVLSVWHSKIHPTINHEHPDPDCDLDYVPGTAREKTVNIAITNSFGFGGHNAVLAVKKWENQA
jgi:3-oxoacyl-[acyl-carrier-protein] synthase II